MTEQSPLVDAQLKFQQAIPKNSLTSEKVMLANAATRILAHDISAEVDAPPYPRSIVEGFLVMTEETQPASEESPIQFKIKGKISPNDEQVIIPEPGEGVEVATGSILPGGSYSIVRMWEAKINNDQFTISRPFPPRFFIEEQGCDIAQGDIVITAGTRLNASHIGALASLGIDEVAVVKSPRVAVFASGDEVIPHTATPRKGAIFDCNSPMLAAAITSAGGIANLHGIQSDHFATFVANVKNALQQSDMIVISGGTAIDGRDFISDLIKEVGELIIDGVQMRSGRPLIMGLAGNKPIICVAGHPPEALRGFNLFGVLAMSQIAGCDNKPPVDNPG